MHGAHLVNHIHHAELESNNVLDVVLVCSNPARFHSRYRLARETISRLAKTSYVRLTVVETAFGNRKHELREICHEFKLDYIPLRTRTEIWIKENMINLGIRHVIVKYNAQNLAWVDADVEFRNEGWALETIHQLQHYQILQPWQSAVNCGPTGNISKSFNSVGEMIRKGSVGMPKTGKKYSGDPYIFGHTGYAWACRRSFWEHVGGLIEFAILGSADHHMALGCRGYYSHSVHSAMKGPFMDLCHAWQTKAMQLTNGMIGYVDGRIEHSFHGPMERRFYVNRWEILITNGFNPITQLHKDAQGLIYLVGNPPLEHAIHKYNRERFEDSIEEY